jgi:hypothetical protein
MDIKNYLIHSYLYYELDESIISDTEFDCLCQRLDMNWPNQQSVYKKYISKADLKAGTGFSLFYDPKTGRRDYPEEIVAEAQTRLVTYRAKQVVTYRTVTDNPEELYEQLKDAADWFLTGLWADYKHFVFGDKREMALAVIERIFKERTKNE